MDKFDGWMNDGRIERVNGWTDTDKQIIDRSMDRQIYE